MTAHPAPSGMVRLAAGMDDDVTKPIRVEALVQALQQARTRQED